MLEINHKKLCENCFAQIGKGGFGTTYLAYDKKLECRMAVKEYYPYGLAVRSPGTTAVSVSNAEAEETFRNGAEKFYDEARLVAQSVSNALMAAHSLNVLHRDISPDNIMVCKDGTIKLLDFGAARQIVTEGSQSLSVILKQGFAPLEQYQKKGKQGLFLYGREAS